MITNRDIRRAAGLVSVSLNLNVLTRREAELIVRFLCAYFQDSCPKQFVSNAFIKACGLDFSNGDR